MDVTNGVPNPPGHAIPPEGPALPDTSARQESSQRPALVGRLSRAHAPVRTIAQSFRRLLGRQSPPPTVLVACSGGADSCALLVALALTMRRLAVGHVIHDLRPPAEALADRDAAAALARSLSLPFHETSVTVPRGPGSNAESSARRLRYEALAAMARASGAAAVATGHHADDQLETLLMALLRGSGPAGLRGIAPRRALAPGIMLIRPCLAVTRAQCREICRLGGVNWREDATNADSGRFRAALRHDIIPRLVALRPAAPRHAATTAELCRDAARLIDARVEGIFGTASSWERAALRDQSAIVVGAGLRRAAVRLRAGEGADALTSRVVGPAVRAVRDRSTEPRSFDWPGGLRLLVTAARVEFGISPR